MRSRFFSLVNHLRRAASQLRPGSKALALLPIVILIAYWQGGEAVLIAAAVIVPLTMLALRFMRPGSGSAGSDRRSDTRADAPVSVDVLADALDKQLKQARALMLKSACIYVAIDDLDAIVSRFGHSAAQSVSEQLVARLRTAVRAKDRVFQLSEDCAAIAIAPVKIFDLEVALQMSARLQLCVEEPVSLDAATIYVSASIGFCTSSQLQRPTGTILANSAALALEEAQRHAPSAIRAFSADMRALESAPAIRNDEVINALENQQILPWFQPQISNDTGQISGFEALARWMHPQRGLISPAEFLPLLEQSAKLERLGEIMLTHALDALTSWDKQGFHIPHVGVNFSPDELRNPRLVEKVEWELDKFDLSPDRLVVEILETVVATSPDDMVTRNINGLSTLGCLIDLDDFGTGHASISSIRRFAIQRLKIDRSFVMKVDQDAEQQRMLSAILLMAERLDLDTLAEGVETAGEHNMLAQLGCGHVQGFGIARPMPFDKTGDWITEHASKLALPHIPNRKCG